MFPTVLRLLGAVALSTGCVVSAFGATAEPPAPVPVADAARRTTVPDGFKVALFAGEPDIVQPIAMATDARGRLWVIESLSYPDWSQATGPGKDRVVILEDRDGDGRSDSRQVFLDNGRNLSGIALGFGGVWLCSAPELIFIPDHNGDDKPDGALEIVLNGWSLEAKHNMVNGLGWGPDGWLYGCHGILADSKVGQPGAPDSKRTIFNCAVWRVHPTRRDFEVVAHGTTNPWGVAFNERGQLFIANCVIKHLFHVIPGAHYERMYGQDLNRYAFQLIESCANHIHWAGGFWDTEGVDIPQNDAFGGGHAHSGALVYLGDTWPDRYRDTFLTVNIHGHRVNNDRLERRGSGYVATHLPDVFRADDSWFRGVGLAHAHDGAVYVSDWSDGGECHDYDEVHRENGRIFKISYGDRKTAPVDLRKLSDTELAAVAIRHRNEWHASNARLLLQERAGGGKLDSNTRATLLAGAEDNRVEINQLRNLWALHVVDALDEAVAISLLASPHEYVRAWAVQLAFEKRNPSERLLRELQRLAERDTSAVVRLYAASTLQRLSLEQRLPIALALASHAGDAADANLPLMIWYGIEPIIAKDDTASTTLLLGARIPLVRSFIARRLALRMALDPVIAAISRASDAGLMRDSVRGLFDALNGRRDLRMPAQWPEAADRLKAHADLEVREHAVALSLIFGDAKAASELHTRATDASQPAAERQRALQALVQARVTGVVKLLQSVITDEQMRGTAIRGLAAFDDPATPQTILGQYAQLTPPEKADAITTLGSRADYAVALLAAVKQGAVPPKDISPFAARQIQALKDPRIAPLVQETLGQFRGVADDKKVQIAKYKKLLTTDALKAADLSKGRAVFDRTCASCHKLFDQGGTLAPELTGSQRMNLDYVLENVVDPNAVVSNLYRATYFETEDGRLISGVVLRENESTVTIQTQTGTETLPRNEIAARTQSALSMMPEGLLDGLSEREAIDLVAYLQSSRQVPLP